MVLGSLFKYNNNKARKDTVENDFTRPESKLVDDINLGLIGAGSHTQNQILPAISNNKKIKIVGISTLSGINTTRLSKKYNISYSTSETNKIINDKNINCVFILSQHDTHASYAIAALSNDKHIFVEKPLSLNKEDLDKISDSYKKSKGKLLVGFNRRFSSHSQKAKKLVENRKGPLFINYRISAGHLPKDHWFHDEEKGGGRINSEPVHFLDLCNFLVGKKYTSILSQNTTFSREDQPNEDTFTTSIKYADGSLCNISYISSGDNLLDKEKIEIFFDDNTIVIDDFKNSTFSLKNKASSYKTWSQDKGFKTMFESFFKSLETSEELINFSEIYDATIMTLLLRNQLKGIYET